LRAFFAALLVLAMGGLSLPLLWGEEAKPAPDSWRKAVVASLDGYSVTGEEFARKLFLLGYHDDREILINRVIVAQQARARGVRVDDAEVESSLKKYVAEMIKRGEAADLDELLYVSRLTRPELEQQVRMRLALKKMVMADRKVSEDLVVNAIPLWLEEKRNESRIVRFSLEPDQPLVNCAEVNGEPIGVKELVRQILRRKSDEEIEDFLEELTNFHLVRRKLEEMGKPLTREDLLDEFHRLSEEVKEDPKFNGVPLMDILAAQKKTIEDLMNEPGFQLRAMIRKACDAAHPISVEEQRKYFEAHRAALADREVMIRIISLYYRDERGRPREGVTRESVLEQMKEIVERLKKGEKFEDLAKQYAQDAGLKESGGLVGMPLKDDSAIFRYLPELKVIFKGKPGEIMGPIESKYGVHLVRIEGVKDKSFEEVQAKVLHEMRVEIRKKWLSDLRREKHARNMSAPQLLAVFFEGLRPPK